MKFPASATSPVLWPLRNQIFFIQYVVYVPHVQTGGYVNN